MGLVLCVKDLLKYESEQRGGVVTMAEFEAGTSESASGSDAGGASGHRGGCLVPINTAVDSER